MKYTLAVFGTYLFDIVTITIVTIVLTFVY